MNPTTSLNKETPVSPERPRPSAFRLSGAAAWLSLFAGALGGCGSEPSYAGAREEAEIWVGSTDLLGAEDDRASGAEAWATLGAGLENADARIRARTARALGRLERTEAVPMLLPLLTDYDPRVRAEAANALGQAVWTVVPPPDGANDPDGDSLSGDAARPLAGLPTAHTVTWLPKPSRYSPVLGPLTRFCTARPSASGRHERGYPAAMEGTQKAYPASFHVSTP